MTKKQVKKQTKKTTPESYFEDVLKNESPVKFPNNFVLYGLESAKFDITIGEKYNWGQFEVAIKEISFSDLKTVMQGIRDALN